MEFLIEAGYSPDNAELLALSRDIDWHKAVDIMKHCKDEDLAMKVLL